LVATDDQAGEEMRERGPGDALIDVVDRLAELADQADTPLIAIVAHCTSRS
jgi:hypothetical protein